MSTAAIIKLLRSNTGATDIHTVFRDFCTASAVALRNRVDPRGHQEREEEYAAIQERYSEAQMTRFAEALALLAVELSTGPHDVLGEVYMQLGIASRDQGQFYTPYDLCRVIALMQLGDVSELLQERPFITVAEPCVGAGAMVLAVAQTLTEQGIDYTERLHVTATDLSLAAVHQAYIQMSLTGIAGVVHHGNTLSLEVFSSWPTATHILGGWDRRLATTAASAGDPQ